LSVYNLDTEVGFVVILDPAIELTDNEQSSLYRYDKIGANQLKPSRFAIMHLIPSRCQSL